ncbi:MAG TPA: hypothetical protein DCL35_08230 [Candidatus Omnitrophica bacterium]|nr:hypothetical protein [Candidatus Omnitrophota bacterium]
MKQAIKNILLNFSVSSLQELEKALEPLANVKKQPACYASLDLYGPSVLVRQFTLVQLSPREIKNALILEAVEVFSLSPEEIAIDYQVLHSSPDKVNGIFVAIPKNILKGYVACLDKAGLTPVKIGANMISRLDRFLKKEKVWHGDFCLIDFYKDDIVNMAVFHEGNCGFLREIRYDNIAAGEREVAYSLKYACSRSSHKQFGDFYCMGDIEGKEKIVSSLEKDYSVRIKRYDARDNTDACPGAKPVLKPDLVKYSGSSWILWKAMSMFFNSAVILSFLIILFLSATLIKNNGTIKKFPYSVSKADYERAKAVQERINRASHAK